MLRFQKFDIFTRGDPCAGISKINIYLQGGLLCWNFKDRHFYKGYPYISLKYHFKNAEKEGKVICKGGGVIRRELE